VITWRKSNHITLVQYVWPKTSIIAPTDHCDLCQKIKKLFNIIYSKAPSDDLLQFFDELEADASDTQVPLDPDEEEGEVPLPFTHAHRIWFDTSDTNEEGFEIEVPTIPYTLHKDEKIETWINRFMNSIKKQMFIKNITDEDHEKISLKQKEENRVIRKKIKDEAFIMELYSSDEDGDDESVQYSALSNKSGTITIKRPPSSILSGILDYKKLSWVPHDYQLAEIVTMQQMLDSSEQFKKFIFQLLLWKMGAGKTSGILASIQQLDTKGKFQKINAVMDKTIMEQWLTEILAFFPALQFSAVYNFYGYDEFKRLVKEDEDLIADSITIVDECQEYRCLKPSMLIDLEAYQTAKILIGLSGTPIMSVSSDVAYLLMINGSIPLRSMEEIVILQEEYKLATNSNMSKKRRMESKEEDLPKRLKDVEENIDEDRMVIKKSKIKLKSLQEIGEKKNFTFDFTDPEYCKWFFKELKDKIFYYSPDNPVQITNNDIRVPMTLMQTFWYIYKHDQNPIIGGYEFGTATRNSFESISRRYGNCVIGADGQIEISPKFDALCVRIHNQMKKGGQEHKFPWAISSIYLELGILGFQQVWEKYKKEHHLILRDALITGKVANREEIRKMCIEGKVDLLLLSPVCNRGLDLPNFSEIVLTEILDSPGQESQVVGRICRSGNNSAVKSVVVTRLISIFLPATYVATPQEEKELLNFFYDFAKTDEKEMRQHGMIYRDGPKKGQVSLVPALMEKMQQFKITADEKRVISNIRKFKEIQIPETILKAASIPFSNSHQVYVAEYQKLLML